METVELRPLSLGELLDRTFSLYRSHFWLFVGIMAIPSAFMIPVNFLVYSLQGSMVNTAASGRPPIMPTPGLIGGIAAGYFLFLIVIGVVYAIATGAATCAVADAYLGRSATVRGSFGRIRGRFWRLMGVFFNILFRVMGFLLLFVGVAVGLVLGIGFAGGARGNPAAVALLGILAFLIYIAGLVLCVWFALRYSVSIPVLMVENTGVLDTIRRSVLLTRGRRGHIFLALLIAAIIAYVGIIVFQGPFMVFTMASAVRGHWPAWLAPASAISAAIGGAITGPISMIVIVLLYYDTRIRKEAFDLQFMMSSLDRPAPAAGTVSPA